MKAFFAIITAIFVSMTTASLVRRQTPPPGHFFITTVSDDSTVNGKFAFDYLGGGAVFIGPAINHQGWEAIYAFFNTTDQTIQGGYGDNEHLWVIRDQQGATTFVPDSQITSGAALDAPYSVTSDGEITSLWQIPYPYGWTTCKEDTFNGPGSNILYYQKFGPTCTPVKLVTSQGPIVY